MNVQLTAGALVTIAVALQNQREEYERLRDISTVPEVFAYWSKRVDEIAGAIAELQLVPLSGDMTDPVGRE